MGGIKTSAHRMRAARARSRRLRRWGRRSGPRPGSLSRACRGRPSVLSRAVPAQQEPGGQAAPRRSSRSARHGADCPGPAAAGVAASVSQAAAGMCSMVHGLLRCTARPRYLRLGWAVPRGRTGHVRHDQHGGTHVRRRPPSRTGTRTCRAGSAGASRGSPRVPTSTRRTAPLWWPCASSAASTRSSRRSAGCCPSAACGCCSCPTRCASRDAQFAHLNDDAAGRLLHPGPGEGPADVRHPGPAAQRDVHRPGRADHRA